MAIGDLVVAINDIGIEDKELPDIVRLSESVCECDSRTQYRVDTLRVRAYTGFARKAQYVRSVCAIMHL